MLTERELNETVKKLQRGMTVRDLIAELQNYDEDAVVVFQSNYGDYHRTQQALTVTEVVSAEDEQMTVAPTAYSQSGLCLREHEGLEDEEADEQLDAEELASKKAYLEKLEDMPKVVILR